MNFLRDYMLATSGTESPEVYHKWSALSALSAIVGSRVWVDQQVFKCYPNMYVLLVGEAGIKKSTAMLIAKKLVTELKTIPVAADSVTKEGLTMDMGNEESPYKIHYKLDDKLVKSTQCSFFCDELATLLEAGGNVTQMITFLTTIFSQQDNPEFRVETKTAGRDAIEHPNITLLGCLTTDYMTNIINNKIVTAGFHRRCIFVYSPKGNDPVAFPEITAEQKAAMARCAERAKQVQKIAGEFTWAPGAKEFYGPWYDKCYELAHTDPSKVRRGFYQTKPVYILKLAMLIQLAEYDTLELTPENLQIALAFIDEIEPDMAIVFEGTGRNELSPIMLRMRDFVTSSSDPVSIKRIVLHFRNDANFQEIKEMLGTLSQSEEILLFSATIKGKSLDFAARPDFDVASMKPES